MRWNAIAEGDRRNKTRFLIFPKILGCRNTIDEHTYERLEWRWMCWATWEQKVKAVQARRGDYKYLEWRDTFWIGKP